MVDPDAVRNLRFGPYGVGDGRFDGTAFLDALQVVKNHFVSGFESREDNPVGFLPGAHR